MQEVRRFRPSTVSRRFSVVAGFYRTCVIDGVLEHSPAEHVRRPAVPAESPTLGFTHLQFEALLTAARESANDNDFALVGSAPGPYRLRIGIFEQRLVFDVRDSHDHKLRDIVLSLTPFRKVVKDYFLVCESYYAAIKKLGPSQIEALDMGRRGLHNEGSELLRERLAGKIEVDLDTARRLFTLICALHITS